MAESDRPGAAAPGDADPERVEVWCASLDRWVPGFDLVSSGREGCIVRRRSDGEVLPIAFSGEHVRAPAGPEAALPPRRRPLRPAARRWR